MFGTKTRGVDIPRIREDFETNVPGLYIVGELGGMGLIRNAFEQGRQCIDGIVRKGDRARGGDVLDLVIVGAGPAGLAASLYAREAGLRFVTLEREADPGGTVRHYPRKKLVMTSPVTIPGFGKLGSKQIVKEDLIEMWDRISDGLPIRTGRTVNVRDAERARLRGRGGCRALPSAPGRARDRTTRRSTEAGRAGRGARQRPVRPGRARGVQRRPGARGRWRRFGGGGRPGHQRGAGSRGPHLVPTGPVQPHQAGQPHPSRVRDCGAGIWRSTGRAASRGSSATSCGSRTEESDAEARPLLNDQVLIFAGGELPTRFLQGCGVQIETKFGTA